MANGSATYYDWGLKSALENMSVLQNMKVPSINFEAVAASQRKNVEAVTKSGELALEGAQAIAKRQGEIVRQSAEDLSEAVRELMSADSPEAAAVMLAELTKSNYQKGLANAWELGELVTKVNSRTFGVINKRVAASLDEVKTIVSPPAPASRKAAA